MPLRFLPIADSGFIDAYIYASLPVKRAKSNRLCIQRARDDDLVMIEGVTLTTTTTYVQSHEDEARSLIRAMIDATHFFKTKKADTLAIIKKHCTELLKMQNDEEWDCFYDTQAASLEAKPYPTLDAIQNVFALALKRDPEIKNFNPLSLWDLHYLREIDDSGYINRLYG
jgi:hypothetical protein